MAHFVSPFLVAKGVASEVSADMMKKETIKTKHFFNCIGTYFNIYWNACFTLTKLHPTKAFGGPKYPG
jgi:hypothetical protein